MSPRTAWTSEAVQEAIGAHLTDPPLLASLATVAPTLAAVLNHDISGAAASAQLAAAQPLFEALRAKRVKAERQGAVIDFGASVIGDARIGDVAGGDIVKIVINLDGQAFTLGERTPFHDVEQGLVEKLRKVDPLILAEAAGVMDIDLEAGGIAPAWAVARGLLHTDFGTLQDVIRVIAPSACDDIQTLVDVVAPFCWITPDAAARIPPVRERPPGRRGICINADDPGTGIGYVFCAPMPKDERIVTSIDGSWGESAADRVGESIIAQLVQKKWCEDEEGCMDDLAANGISVFVVVPPPTPPPGVLEALRATFPSLTFVLLAGSATGEGAFAGLGLTDVEYLMPELAAGGEAVARKGRFNALRTARLKCELLP